ncbi:MAG TPA: pyridoxine 5'-phosphate synthase [Myxococcota bacterium]|nr:pyridoxine 5'-phosphate synthase [Myxococcota bacterium]
MHRKLGVNIDHIATIRQARRTKYPDPVAAAAIAEAAGADQITVHLREDRRHIQERDVRILRETVQTTLNLEMGATQEMLKIALDVKPDIVTLVPERREELTTEGGLDVNHHRDHLKKYVQSLRDADLKVSLFIDPDLEMLRAAHRLDAPSIELHTGKYADARDDVSRRNELRRIADAARAAAKLGMRVAAGHGLHYTNVQELVLVEEIEELNIGHSIVARAMLVGMDQAVRDMVHALKAPPK